MEEERNYTVYMHVNKLNEKVYIGITGKTTNQRWKNNGDGYRGQIFYKAIQKYGWNNFEHIILFENKTKEEAEKLEILYIKILLSNNRTYGYNIANGGKTSGTHSKETKIKIGESNKGRKVSIETRQRISENATWCKKVSCDNMIFKSIKNCADYYEINYTTMSKWLNGKNGIPQKFIDLNLHFLNIKNASHSPTINKLIKPQLKRTGKNNSQSKKVYCDGIIFDSLSECADYYNVNKSTMIAWLIGQNNMREDFIKMNLHYVGEKEIYIKKDNERLQKVITNDRVFNSVKECAEYYGVNYSTMRSWFQGIRGMPKKFVDLGLHYEGELTPELQKDKSKKIICNEIIFNSILDCSNYYNVNYVTFKAWLRGQNKTPQKYTDLGLRYYSTETDGDIEQYEQYIAS